MKKIFSFLVVFVLIMGMNMNVFAEEVNVGTGSCSAEVHGVYNAGKDAEVEYSVDVCWSELSFTYTAGDKSWDAENHKYIENAGTWATDTEGDVLTGEIEITNHSNNSISVELKWKADDGYSEALMKFKNAEDVEIESMTIASAAPVEGTGKGEEQNGVIKVEPSGYLPVDTNGKIGVITITISGLEID